MNEQNYRDQQGPEIRSVLDTFDCQPILFLGSGFSRRYIGAPSWTELLKELAERPGVTDKTIEYFIQDESQDLAKVGSRLARPYFEWAWGKGRKQFPDELFDSKGRQDGFLKFAAAEIFAKIDIAGRQKKLAKTLQEELAEFQKIFAHAFITTNYDTLIQSLRPNYEPVVGQSVIRMSNEYMGEILKIHGCCTKPRSLILTSEDYEFFHRRQKYITAKLIAYFLEHPVFIMGYNVADSNVKAILSDVAEILKVGDGKIPNIFFVKWVRNPESYEFGQTEHVIKATDGSEFRINMVEVSEYSWLYKLLSENRPMADVNPKVLRAFLARTYEVVRTDIPRSTVEIDFKNIESAAMDEKSLPKLLGITKASKSTHVNLTFPYTASTLAHKAGLGHFNYLNQKFSEIKDKTGFDIKKTDNAFHVTIKTGNAAGSKTNKYSAKALELVQKHMGGESVRKFIKDTLADEA